MSKNSKTHNGAEETRKEKIKIKIAYKINRAVSKPYSCAHTPIMYSGRTVASGYAELCARAQMHTYFTLALLKDGKEWIHVDNYLALMRICIRILTISQRNRYLRIARL